MKKKRNGKLQILVALVLSLSTMKVRSEEAVFKMTDRQAEQLLTTLGFDLTDPDVLKLLDKLKSVKEINDDERAWLSEILENSSIQLINNMGPYLRAGQ